MQYSILEQAKTPEQDYMLQFPNKRKKYKRLVSEIDR